MIKSKDQLKIQLLKHNKHERLDRHADVEIAYAQAQDTVKLLTESLKQSQLECAGLRSQLKKIVVEHSNDK